MLPKDDETRLVPGSKYTIRSLGTKDEPIVSSGVFKGYAVVGNVDAVCMELDGSHGDLKGKVRLIPSHMILTIDILSTAEPKKEAEEEVTSRYYR